MQFSCINCGKNVKELYKTYSPTVLKLSTCNFCDEICDKYIEYDSAIIMIDLILLKKEAYRHFLYNTNFKNHWKLFVLVLLMESFSEWMFDESKHNYSKKSKKNFNQKDFLFYIIFIKFMISTLVYNLVLYILTLFVGKLLKKIPISFEMIIKTYTISSFGYFFLLPALIWTDHTAEQLNILFVFIYTTLCQFVVYTIVSELSIYWSIILIILSNIAETITINEMNSTLEKKQEHVLQKMAYTTKTFHFLSGHFEWDDTGNKGLVFISHEIPNQLKEKKTAKYQQLEEESYFREDIDLTDKMNFRKFFQRKCKTPETDIITLQDIKDVVIFSANVRILTTEFIRFFHIPTVDRFLRALIIYFQYHFLVFNKLIKRRTEVENTIYQPVVTELENITRDNLSDLRSMVSREYCSILIGSRDCRKYHHMTNKNRVSLSDRDRRLIELLIKMSTRVVWYALHRPSLNIIERETDRLCRSVHFNKFDHRHISKTKMFDNERKILIGTADVPQKRLVAQSPLTKEVILARHDHRMLAIGEANFPPSDKRKRFLEKLYLLPEEYLVSMGVCVGILGHRRDDYDVMLKRKRKKTYTLEDELIFHLDIPTKSFDVNRRFSTETKESVTFSQVKPLVRPLFSRAECRRRQCKIWAHWVDLSRNSASEHELMTQITSISHSLNY